MSEGRATQIAKQALRRLATSKLEPTPENYARAYAAEAGGPLPEPALPERAVAPLMRLVQLGVSAARCAWCSSASATRPSGRTCCRLGRARVGTRRCAMPSA